MRTVSNASAVCSLLPLLLIAGKLPADALQWYLNATEVERQLADRIANELAHDIFAAKLTALSAEEATQLHTLTRYAFLRTPSTDRP